MHTLPILPMSAKTTLTKQEKDVARLKERLSVKKLTVLRGAGRRNRADNEQSRTMQGNEPDSGRNV